MASFPSFLAILTVLMACHCSASSASRQSMHISTISAAPAFLPGAPLVSPTLSPDIEPLFPTPGGASYPPAESSLPTIPSSPSPPNPDAIGTPVGSMAAFPPSDFMPVSSPASQASSQLYDSNICLGLLVICIMQLHGM